ncbi:MAG: histidine--tRNA ligase [Candidatus Altiarchaeota archaeon]
MVFERPRGVRDFGPDEMRGRLHAESTISRVFESFGYRRVQTPTFEFLELFELKSGSDIREHLFVFDDKGGRKLCLRPEATAQVARMYASELRSLPKPLRVCYLSQMFRYEEPQKGRYREFWQAGVELLGVSGAEADAEVVCLAAECLKRLGLRFKLRVSHIGVLRRLLALQGLEAAEQDDVIHLLDRGDFKSVEGRIKDESFKKILGLRGLRDVVGSASELVSDAGVKATLEELDKTLTLLDFARVDYEVDFSMARGLDYYTGMVFDVRVEGLGAQNQVCGGGRYDNLIELFGGPQTPAVGFAFGLDRILESMQEQGADIPKAETDVYVVPISDDMRGEAFRIAVELRRKMPDCTVEYELSGRKLNKALQHASEINARYAVIVGATELKEQSVMLKDLKTQKQDKVKITELSSKIMH